MAACPVCGASVEPASPECPTCHLDVALFVAVRDAAAMTRDTDPVYLKTVAELLRSVDLSAPAFEAPSPPAPASPAPAAEPPDRAPRPVRAVAPLPLPEIPSLPELPRGDALRSRAHEYHLLAEQLGADLGDPSARASVAEESDDEEGLGVAVREMFVHLASLLVAAYDVEAARRNEIASHGPVAPADLELHAMRRAIVVGDLTGARRHLLAARATLGRLQEGWATGRILLTECELLVETLRELGGDPSPAARPLEEARRLLDGPRPERAEMLLAQTAHALWTRLEPRFTEELKRLRDRLVELREGGADLTVPLAKLRTIGTELSRRNFAGAIGAHRQLRELLGPVEPAPLVATGAPERATPPA